MMPKPNNTAPSKSSVFSPGPVTPDRTDTALPGLPLGCPKHWLRAQPGALTPLQSLLKPAVPTKPAPGTPSLAAAWPDGATGQAGNSRAQENPGREPDRHQWAQGEQRRHPWTH